MARRIERSEQVGRDLDAIFHFLYGAALDFGERPQDAYDRAASRINAIEALARAPCQGALRTDLGPDLRQAGKGRAVFCFRADDVDQTVRVLAVLFGGQHHHRAMLIRLLKGDDPAQLPSGAGPGGVMGSGLRDVRASRISA